MLGDQIRRLRQAQGMKQETLANKLGVSKQSVSNWENGNIMPSIELLVRLADHFGVSTDYLLDRDERVLLDVTGLTEQQFAHLQQLARDLQQSNGT
jgi:transcriptional regulator with XRE-family HTH domain